jgi:hypothetical protein
MQEAGHLEAFPGMRRDQKSPITKENFESVAQEDTTPD